MRIALVLLLALGLCASAHTQAPTRAYIPIKTLNFGTGQQLPDFDGIHTLAAYRGKPLLINFYTVHCSPCIREIPILNALQQRYPELQVLAITPDTTDEAAAYAEARGLRWPIATPGEDYIFANLGIQAFPSFALLDAHGQLLAATYGNQLGEEEVDYASLAGISRWVESALGKKLD